LISTCLYFWFDFPALFPCSSLLLSSFSENARFEEPTDLENRPVCLVDFLRFLLVLYPQPPPHCSLVVSFTLKEVKVPSPSLTDLFFLTVHFFVRYAGRRCVNVKKVNLCCLLVELSELPSTW